MNANELEKELNNLLLSECRSTQDSHLEVTKRDSNCFIITYGQMYDSPELSFEKLLELSEMFGTKKIDVDDYANSGCDTCDYGSDYGHEIQIYNPTLLVEELEKLSE